MHLKIFTVLDSKAEAFIQPFFSATTATAIRSFTIACNDQGHAFHRHSGDYTLFELGEFDQLSAIFDLHVTPINLGLAIQYIDQGDLDIPQAVETTPTNMDRYHEADPKLEIV